jgi:hypothetical protein
MGSVFRAADDGVQYSLDCVRVIGCCGLRVEANGIDSLSLCLDVMDNTGTGNVAELNVALLL